MPPNKTLSRNIQTPSIARDALHAVEEVGIDVLMLCATKPQLVEDPSAAHRFRLLQSQLRSAFTQQMVHMLQEDGPVNGTEAAAECVRSAGQVLSLSRQLLDNAVTQANKLAEPDYVRNRVAQIMPALNTAVARHQQVSDLVHEERKRALAEKIDRSLRNMRDDDPDVDSNNGGAPLPAPGV